MSALEAWRSLIASRQRSALALVGIVIGVAAVSAMMSVGAVVKARAMEQFREMGTEIMSVRVRARERGGAKVNLTLEQARSVAALPGVESAAPYTTAARPIVLSGTVSSKATIIGATQDLMELGRMRTSEGRFVSELDGAREFCTVGSAVAAQFEGPPIGQTVRIAGSVHRVIGVLERVGGSGRGFEVNKAVFIPVEAARRVTPNAPLRDLIVRRAPGSDYRASARNIVAYLSEAVPQARVAVSSPEELIEGMHRQMRLYTLLLGSVSAIALLVGGIGVMNVMLAAVAERRAEIGVRRALGARKRDVRGQILTESILLSLVGGVIGVAAGAGATYAICTYNAWEYQSAMSAYVLGIAVACGTGVVFAHFPARQAANMTPVEALRTI